MALTLKSQPRPHPPTPRLQRDPYPRCQPPTTTPPGGHAYPDTQPPAHHHPAAVSFGLHKPPPLCPVVVGFGSRIHQAPRRSYTWHLQPTTRTNSFPNGYIYPCMLPTVHHHPAAVGHRPDCPKHHQQSSAPAYPNAKTSPPGDRWSRTRHHQTTRLRASVRTANPPHGRRLRHALPHTFSFFLGYCFSLVPLLCF